MQECHWKRKSIGMGFEQTRELQEIQDSGNKANLHGFGQLWQLNPGLRHLRHFNPALEQNHGLRQLRHLNPAPEQNHYGLRHLRHFNLLQSKIMDFMHFNPAPDVPQGKEFGGTRI